MPKIYITIESDEGDHLAEFTAPNTEIAYEKLLKFEQMSGKITGVADIKF